MYLLHFQLLDFVVYLLLFVFFKQKTAYEMRISDWSSDVCSSDLPLRLQQVVGRGGAQRPRRRQLLVGKRDAEAAAVVLLHLGAGVAAAGDDTEAGDVHGADVHLRLALNQPLRQHQAAAPPLAESGPDADGAPHIVHARYPATPRGAVGA